MDRNRQRWLGLFMHLFSWCHPFVRVSIFVNNLFLNTVLYTYCNMLTDTEKDNYVSWILDYLYFLFVYFPKKWAPKLNFFEEFWPKGNNIENIDKHGEGVMFKYWIHLDLFVKKYLINGGNECVAAVSATWPQKVKVHSN